MRPIGVAIGFEDLAWRSRKETFCSRKEIF